MLCEGRDRVFPGALQSHGIAGSLYRCQKQTSPTERLQEAPLALWLIPLLGSWERLLELIRLLQQRGLGVGHGPPSG